MNQRYLGGDVPIGLGVALAKNEAALAAFNALDEDRRRCFISGARAVRSKEEMRNYVSSLTTYTAT